MIEQDIFELSNYVYSVGFKDWNRRLFDVLILLPKGTSYNSYLIVGKDKKALIDTVNPETERQWEQRIDQKTSLSEIDYLIMNQPDHAGTISYLMSVNSREKIVTTWQDARMTQAFYNVTFDGIMTGKEKDLGQIVDIGKRLAEKINSA